VARNEPQSPPLDLAIVIDGEACGGVGVILGTDIERWGRTRLLARAADRPGQVAPACGPAGVRPRLA
jgi:hypothetical protein